MKKIIIILSFLFFFQGVEVSKDLEVDFLKNLSNLVNYKKDNVSEFLSEALKYHLLLWKMGETERALSILKLNDFKLEKDSFIENIFSKKLLLKNLSATDMATISNGLMKMAMDKTIYLPIISICEPMISILQFLKDNNMNEEIGKIFKMFNEKIKELNAIHLTNNENLNDLNTPTNDLIIEDLIDISRFFLNTGYKDRAKEILKMAENKSFSSYDDNFCSNLRNPWSHVYQEYRWLGMKREAEEIIKKVYIKLDQCKKDSSRYQVLEAFAFRFYELNEYEQSLKFLDEAIFMMIQEDPSGNAGNVINLANYYIRINRKDRFQKIVENLFDYDTYKGTQLNKCDPQIEKDLDITQKKNASRALKMILDKLPTLKIISEMDISRLIEKAANMKIRLNDPDIGDRIDEVLFWLYLHSNQYNEATIIANKMKIIKDQDRSFEYDRSDYLIFLAKKMIEDGKQIDIENWISRIPSPRYRISLYYYWSESLIKKNVGKEAIPYLQKILDLLKENYDPNWIGGVNTLMIAKLYFKIGDIHGLDLIKQYYNKISFNRSKWNSSILSSWQVALYRKQGKIESALLTIEKMENTYYKALSYLHIARYFIKNGNKEMGEKYLNHAYLYLKKNPKEIDQFFFDELYRIFAFTEYDISNKLIEYERD